MNGRLLASGRSGAELTVRAVNETSFAQLVIVPPRQGEVVGEYALMFRFTLGDSASQDSAVKRGHVSEVCALAGHPFGSRITGGGGEHGLDLLGWGNKQRDVYTVVAVYVESGIHARGKLGDGEEQQTDRTIEFGGRSVLLPAGVAWWRCRRPGSELLRRGDRGTVAFLVVVLPQVSQVLVAASMFVIHASQQPGPPYELLGMGVKVTTFAMQLEDHSFAGSPGVRSQGLSLIHI